MIEGEQIYFLAATCSRGTESRVREEITGFGGAEVTEGVGVVNWQGSLESAYRACLWSRFASRVLLRIAEFAVSDEAALFKAAATVNWNHHLDEASTFAVDCTVAKDGIKLHSGFAALKLKDVIVDQFRDRTGTRPSIDTERPDVRINLMVAKEKAIVAVDLSGDSLHRRGYRVAGSKAPLKESLAAAIVALSNWPADPTRLVDPMCGSGTLLIEAALIHGDSAPGLSRSYFGFMGWKQHNRRLWEAIVDEALAREEAGNRRKWPLLIGYDSDPESVRIARKNVSKAGLDNRIAISRAELAELKDQQGPGMLLSNLPFGERLKEKEEVARLYRAIGRIARQECPGWRLAVFISSPELTDSFGLAWELRFRLFNGPLQCRLLVTTIKEEPEHPFVWQLSEVGGDGPGGDFANRLRKNCKRVMKWARKEGVSCYRVYDRDLPEYNVAIDLYEKYIHIQEFAAPASVSPELAGERFRTVVKVVRELFGAHSDRVFIKTRRRQRGKGQYQRSSSTGKMFEVREGDCSFLVNFTEYLDTGLFLDHRPTRKKIFEEARGKRFLNLFGYTGTATVQAAAGGAASTLTVDLSETYLHWTRMNLYLNGFDTVKHQTVRADCLQWLKESRDRFDLIFVDPPTFSNTKKERRVFDVQRDHVRLITATMQRLERGGLLLFSTNFKKFKLDQALLQRYRIEESTATSVPFDFDRTKIHQSWEIRHLDGNN